MLLRCLFLLFTVTAVAQTDKNVLFTIDGEPVYTSEFIRVYNKNLDLVQDESQKDVDAYLDLFVDYKLKLKEAKALDYHKKESYKRELAGYKKQLAKNYMTDTKVTDKLIEEAYQRTLYEVNADHILIRLDESATPEDTLKAYNDIKKLKQRAQAEGFETVRQEVHNGRTIYGEQLGWFRAFKMVYDFENSAYKTEIGEVSEPFRTRFGYHIVKVNDKRKSQGQVTVAHIMVASNKHDNAKSRAQDLYKKLNQGEAFEDVAKQFSDDKNSAVRGGRLEPFASGQLSSSVFENTAFSLKKTGDVSEPFETKFGWHIVKLLKKEAVKPFEYLKPELEDKVKRDGRSKQINQSLVDDMMKKYRLTYEQPALPYFISVLNNAFYQGSWKMPEDKAKQQQPLLKIGSKQYMYVHFGDYLEQNQRRGSAKKPFEILVPELYKSFLNKSLLEYKAENLETENQEYANVVTEYRDGLLLFDLMEDVLWSSAKTDTSEIKKFYKSNAKNYVWNKRVEVLMGSCKNKKQAKSLSKLLKSGQSETEIKKALNKNGQVDVMFNSGTMEVSDEALPKNYKAKTGVSKVRQHNGSYVVVKTQKVLPKTTKTYEEAKGLVATDYQEHKEETWLQDLRNKYKVEVNNDVLSQVKTQLKP